MLNSRATVSIGALSGGNNLDTALSLNNCPYLATSFFLYRPSIQDSIEATTILTQGAFWKVRTSINPLRPAQASWMVRHGIYRFTRNPMYLGQLLQLLAWAFWLENLATFAFLPAFVAWMTRFQIIPEERILGIKFGNDYADYLNRVRKDRKFNALTWDIAGGLRMSN